MKKKTTRVTPELPREKEGFDKLSRDQVKVLQSRKRQKSRLFNTCRFSNMRTFHGKTAKTFYHLLSALRRKSLGL